MLHKNVIVQFRSAQYAAVAVNHISSKLPGVPTFEFPDTDALRYQVDAFPLASLKYWKNSGSLTDLLTYNPDIFT